MVGDKRKYNVSLVSLVSVLFCCDCVVRARIGFVGKRLTRFRAQHCEPNEDGSFTNKLTGPSLQIGSKAKTTDEAKECEVWKKYIEDGIKAANEAAVSRASKIQKFRLLPTDLSVPGGELTATLKSKRSVIEEKYADLIEEMYAE